MKNMNIIVMKFGGTSVADEASRLQMIKHIKREVEAGYKIVVVVSAMGRLGSPYATDSLKRLVSPGISPTESDRLLSCGEIISSIVTSDLARREGINVMSLSPMDIGIITNNNYTDADIIYVETDLMKEKFQEYDVLVIPGFVGINEKGYITTLGRGGSDTSAIAIGAAIRADFVDIYSDVAGVYTADPKLDPDAILIKEMTYDKLIEMVEEGARVIHLKAILLAKDCHVNLRLRSTFTEYVGTLVKEKLDEPGEKNFILDTLKFISVKNFFKLFKEEE